MQIDLFSDLVCPWCYIGKRHLDAALLALPDADIQLRWRAYQLSPALPSQGVNRQDYYRQRFGPRMDPARVPERMAEQARSAGLAFHFERIERMPNTRLGHRLMALAEPSGRQHDLAEILFRYYFVEGRDIGALEILLAAADEAGLDVPVIRAALSSGGGNDAVDEDLSEARERDISGVPAFLLAGRFVLPGAQPVDTLVQFIEQARSRFG